MENIAVSKLMKIIETLSFENKLDLLSKLSENLKIELKPITNKKEDLLNELFGSWKNMDENLSEDILKIRTISNKDISFD